MSDKTNPPPPNFLDAVTALARRNREDVKECVVEELGGAVVYFTRLTAGEIARLQRKHPEFLSGSGGVISTDALIDLIMLKARDADGNKLLKPTDKEKMTMLPLEVIASIGAEMIGAEATIEEHEGN